MPKLSILIPSVIQHELFLIELFDNLNRQTLPFPGMVEILVDKHETDSTGKKRNRLLEKSCGDYIVFVDSDDYVFQYYVSEVLKGTETDCDCMGIQGYMTTDGKSKIGFELSKDFNNETIRRDGKSFYLRKTNHICPVKRELAMKVMFPDKSNAEDKDYSEMLNPLLKKEYKIIPVMYHYRFSRVNKTYK